MVVENSVGKSVLIYDNISRVEIWKLLAVLLFSVGQLNRCKLSRALGRGDCGDPRQSRGSPKCSTPSQPETNSNKSKPVAVSQSV